MRLLAIIILLIICSCSSAQDITRKYGIGLQLNTLRDRSKLSYSPYGGYWEDQKDLYSGPGLRIKDSSFSSGLIITRNRKESYIWRVRAGITRTDIRSSWSYTDPSFQYTYDAYKKELDYYVAPGAYRVFDSFKFNYYAGMEFPLTVYGIAQVSKTYSYSSLSSGEMLYQNITTGKIRNGYSMGLAPFAGFTITFFENFSFGPEVGVGLLYSDYGSGGEFETYVVNGSTYLITENFETSYKKIGITQPYGSFIVSWHF